MNKNISVFCLFSFIAVCAFTQRTPKKVFKTNTTSPSDSVASFKRGKALYAAFCLTCHQADGGGVPNLNPPLVQTSFVNGKKEPLIKIILKGLNTHVDIDGESYSNNMPPFESLKDQQIADVLTFIRNSFGNKESVVLKTEVQKVRSGLRK